MAASIPSTTLGEWGWRDCSNSLPLPPPSSYAKIHIPIIASVSEHQPTTWTSFFFDLHILVCVFPAGIWFVMKYLTDERVFVNIPEGHVVIT